ncbi:MAG: hypothetical protein ACO1TE_19575 [Prosthecobacter sp.]
MSPEATTVAPHGKAAGPALRKPAAKCLSTPHPSHALLRRYRGAAVKLHINGTSASGVLCFGDDGSPFIASLCFAQGDSECPLFSHVLADHEIATLRRHGPRHLTSAIAITRADSVLHADCHSSSSP